MQAATGEHSRTGNSLLPLDTLGGTIRAHIAAGDKATDKAEEHYKAAGIHLSEAKERIAHTKGPDGKRQTWPAFLIKHCKIGSRRADELISIADGRTSLAELREKTRTKVAEHRARSSALRNAQPAEIPEQEQQNEEPERPKKSVYATPDPRLKIIGQITLKTRDANLAQLQIVDDFFAKIMRKRKSGALN